MPVQGAEAAVPGLEGANRDPTACCEPQTFARDALFQAGQEAASRPRSPEEGRAQPDNGT
jgi:hypothetical protein